MSPTFSIIIPVYNVAPYLRECLDSVLAQTYTDWEAICVDDGSTDGSGEILDEYAAKDSRFCVIHQENKGVSAARNVALDVVQGKWIMFVDGDDALSKNALMLISDITKKYSEQKLIRFAYSNVMDEEKFYVPIVEPNADADVIDISEKIQYNDYYAYIWQFAFRYELINGIRFPRYVRGEDRVYLMQVLCFKANSFVATDEVCYFYRQRINSAMHCAPSIQVLCDEMDHRLDVVEIMEKCGKKISYSGSEWLEKYFTSTLPYIIQTRLEEADLLIKLWHQRLCRARKMKGWSPEGRRYICAHASRIWGWIADLKTFPFLRKRSWICRLYRLLRHTGEYARE